MRADSAKSNCIGDPGFGVLEDSDRNDSSEDDHERKWDSKMRMRSRLGADMLQNKSKYLQDDDEDLEQGSKKKDPRSQGYVLLSQAGEDDEDIVVKRKGRVPILKNTGKGIRALDDALNEDEDRTETDNSIDKPPS